MHILPCWTRWRLVLPRGRPTASEASEARGLKIGCLSTLTIRLSLRDNQSGVDWPPVSQSTPISPPPEDGGLTEIFCDIAFNESDDYTLADSYTLAGDLTFERDNPDSVRNCPVLGRENVRQVRHCISAKMWTCLNLAWLRIRDLDIEDIWKVSPESFYAETMREINTFTRVAASTMYRDEGWHFMWLGWFIERAQLLVALLLAQFAAGRDQDETADTDWTSLLRSCQAFDAYKRSYSVEIQPDPGDSADPLLPGSLCRVLDALAAELAAIGESHDSHAGAAAERLAGRLCTLVRYREDREALLAQVGDDCRKLHSLVTTAYIDYAIEDSPVQKP